MRKRSWNKWAVLLASGAFLLQTPACVETATILTSISSVISAGGVLYLVGRVLE